MENRCLVGHGDIRDVRPVFGVTIRGCRARGATVLGRGARGSRSHRVCAPPLRLRRRDRPRRRGREVCGAVVVAVRDLYEAEGALLPDILAHVLSPCASGNPQRSNDGPRARRPPPSHSTLIARPLRGLFGGYGEDSPGNRSARFVSVLLAKVFYPQSAGLVRPLPRGRAKARRRGFRRSAKLSTTGATHARRRTAPPAKPPLGIRLRPSSRGSDRVHRTTPPDVLEITHADLPAC